MIINIILLRLLVGLRWWSSLNQDGTETWNYESYEDGR